MSRPKVQFVQDTGICPLCGDRAMGLEIYMCSPCWAKFTSTRTYRIYYYGSGLNLEKTCYRYVELYLRSANILTLLQEYG